MRCFRIGYAIQPVDFRGAVVRMVADKRRQQGYEVTEEEVQISLGEFKTKYSDPLGYPEYATLPFSFCTFHCHVEIVSNAMRIVATR